MSKHRKETEADFAQIFKALSNPNRLRIFIKLASCCPPGTRSPMKGDSCFCVGDLGQDLDIVPSTVSHHIKELHRAGLIRSARRGQKVECWVDPELIKRLRDFFFALSRAGNEAA
jgi:ArsR family transcriptional regulator